MPARCQLKRLLQVREIQAAILEKFSHLEPRSDAEGAKYLQCISAYDRELRAVYLYLEPVLHLQGEFDCGEVGRTHQPGTCGQIALQGRHLHSFASWVLGRRPGGKISSYEDPTLLVILDHLPFLTLALPPPRPHQKPRTLYKILQPTTAWLHGLKIAPD